MWSKLIDPLLVIQPVCLNGRSISRGRSNEQGIFKEMSDRIEWINVLIDNYHTTFYKFTN